MVRMRQRPGAVVADMDFHNQIDVAAVVGLEEEVIAAGELSRHAEVRDGEAAEKWQAGCFHNLIAACLQNLK